MVIKDLDACEEFTAADRTRIRELLSPYKETLSIRYSLVHATLRSGETSLPHRLAASEVYYILDGCGTMHIDDETAPVSAHDTVYIPPKSVQFIENTGNGDLLFLCIVDPAWRAEDEEVAAAGS
ncbi:MAG: cupin domain-containing protein [Spirochaetes bacterium]|nr:cupin domain-containing protein [Spirochaetota bacterium]